MKKTDSKGLDSDYYANQLKKDIAQTDSAPLAKAMYIQVEKKTQQHGEKMKLVTHKEIEKMLEHRKDEGHASDVSDVDQAPRTGPHYFNLNFDMKNL